MLMDERGGEEEKEEEEREGVAIQPPEQCSRILRMWGGLGGGVS